MPKISKQFKRNIDRQKKSVNSRIKKDTKIINSKQSELKELKNYKKKLNKINFA